jgi:hypothetical protein
MPERAANEIDLNQDATIRAHFFLAQSRPPIYPRIIGLKVISIPDPPLLPVAGAIKDELPLFGTGTHDPRIALNVGNQLAPGEKIAVSKKVGRKKVAFFNVPTIICNNNKLMKKGDSVVVSCSYCGNQSILTSAEIVSR